MIKTYSKINIIAFNIDIVKYNIYKIFKILVDLFENINPPIALTILIANDINTIILNNLKSSLIKHK